MACPSWTHSDPAWPNIIDSTNGRDGTRWNRALGLSIQQYIDKLTGIYYGLPSPANLAEEIAAARGDMACLDTRLDVAMDESGNLKIPATVATKDDIAGLLGENLMGNDLLMISNQGDAAAPQFWTASAPGTWAITYVSGFGSAQFVAGGAPVSLYQDLVPASMMVRARLLFAGGSGVGFGIWVQTNSSGVRAYVSDGLVTEFSDIHSGSGSAEWLKVAPVGFQASSTYMRVGLEVPAGATISFFAPFAGLGPSAPKGWKPARSRQVIQPFSLVGNATAPYVGATKFQFGAPGDGILESLWMGSSVGVPAAHDATFTLSRWNGAGFDVVDTIQLLATQQYQYKDCNAIANQLKVASAPRTVLNGRCNLFAWGLAVTGVDPNASDLFVAARFKVWERPLYAFFDSGL
jgi:hypothetical protein